MIIKMNKKSSSQDQPMSGPAPILIILISVLILSANFGLCTCDSSSSSLNNLEDSNKTISSSPLPHRSRGSHAHHRHSHHAQNHTPEPPNHVDENIIDTQSSTQLSRQSHPESESEPVFQSEVEDQNELRQLVQSTETATFLSVPQVLQKKRFGPRPRPRGDEGEEREDAAASLIGLVHEKHHLWKLIVEHDDTDQYQGQELESRLPPNVTAVAVTFKHTGTNMSPAGASAFAEFEEGDPNISSVNDGDLILGKPTDTVDEEEIQDTEPTHLNPNGNSNEGERNGNGSGGNLDLQIESNGIVKTTVTESTSSTSPHHPAKVVGCRSCRLNKQLESTLPASSVREMRLELIKEQILRKLGLKEPPNTTYLAKEHLPLPVAQGNTLPKRGRHGRHSHVRVHNRDIEDFYGKTEQVIVFPEDLMPRCVTHRTDPSACFTFNVPQENHVNQVSSAELWVYKLADGKDGRNQSFWVDEVSLSPGDINHSAVRARNVDIKQDIDVREGWMKLNLTRVMPKWLSINNTEHAIQIGCKTCLTDPSESPIDTIGDQRPFIVINYKNFALKKRNRRNINCTPRLTECCRESFVVSFREIGWDSWIIGPETYDAYYCTGSCISINGIAHSTARHTTVMQKYIRTFGMNNKTAKIVPCCTASKMSPITLIYRDPHNLNHTIKYEKLPNMVVESCGCL